jgi:hypothetical protein
MFAVCLIACVRSVAQSAASEISGHVSDPSGASVPRTRIEIRNLETGVERSATSNAEGYFVVPLLAPGDYRVFVSKEGFRPIVQGRVRLRVNQTLKLDIALSVGSVSEAIQVMPGEPLLQRATTEIGTVIESKTVLDLPLNGRDFQQLLSLAPGVNGRSVNGQWGAGNLYHLDGVNNNTVLNATAALVPVLDAVQEFKVQSHNDKAEYGGVLGGIVNVVSKSGTNTPHGSAWEFLRNDKLDARNPFTDAMRKGPTAFRQNQFGGALGGPMYVPRLYNGRDRTFFFLGYEGYRYRRPDQVFGRVPTAAELSGDFSGLGRAIYDPWTERMSGGAIVRDLFPGGRIPAARRSRMVLATLDLLYDRPNYSGDSFYNRFQETAYANDRDNYSIKIDHNAGERDRFWLRYSDMNETRVSWQTESISSPWWSERRNLGFAWVRAVSRDLLVETRLSHANQPRENRNVFGSNSAGRFGETSLLAATGFDPEKLERFALPNIVLSAPWSSPGIAGESVQAGSQPWSASIGATLFKRHEMRLGFQRIQTRLQNVGRGHHIFFKDAQTGDPQRPGITGGSLASALLGLPSDIAYTVGQYTEQFPTWSIYVQDEWKLSPALTLTWGVRYDQFPSPTYTQGMLNDWDFRTGEWLIGAERMPADCGVSGRAPCIPGEGGLSGIPYSNRIRLAPHGPGIRAPIRDNLGPRAGIAWSFRKNLVLRAGFGVFFDVFSATAQDLQNPSGTWPDSSNVQRSLNAAGGVPTTIERIEQERLAAVPPLSPWTTAAWFWDPAKKNALSRQWNIEIQRQLSPQLMTSLAYVGSSSSRLDMIVAGNAAALPGPGTPQEVVARKPFPYMVTTQYGTDWGRAKYHAFQAKVNRVYEGGLQVLAGYTWSKSIDNGASAWYGRGPQDGYHPEASRGPSDYDRTHILAVSGIYELPAGRNRRWFPSGVGASILGGWQVNAITVLQSGAPFDLTVPGDVANIGTSRNYARPDLAGNPNPPIRTNELWYDPKAFRSPLFSFGNFGRNVLRAAPIYNCDLSLIRRIYLGEAVQAQFRFEAFNALNLMNPGTPQTNLLNSNAGRVTSINGRPREIQAAIRLSF